MTSRLLFMMVALLSPTFALSIEPPDTMHYQAVVRDSTGAPLNGTIMADLAYFDAETGGTLLAREVHLDVPVTDGLMSVTLGAASASISGPRITFIVRDHRDVWAELRLEDEVLSPRMKINGTPYAQNAATLAGLPASDYIDNSASDQQKSGALIAGGLISTTPWVRINAAGPDQNQFVHFYENGNFEGESLLWSDDADRFELTDLLRVDGDLELTSTRLSLSVDGPEGDQFINFYNLSARGGEFLQWQEVQERFNFSTDLNLEGELSVDANAIKINANGPNLSQYLYFYRDAEDGEALAWNQGAGRFEFSDGLRLDGGFEFTAGAMRLNVNGPDADQSVYFYDSGSPTGEVVRWEDSADEFLISDDLLIDGGLEVNSTTIRFNEDGPDQDQALYFYDDNASSNEQFRWKNLDDEFLISDDLLVQGNINATGAKPFVQNHPEDAGLSVVYVALEGDEAGVYTRGSGVIEGGEARIALGETFRLVANPEIGLTAHAMPHEPTLIWVDSISTTQLVLRAETKERVSFDYVVYGLRAGYEQFATVAPRRVDAAVPSGASWDATHAARPELRGKTALARFRGMPRHEDSAGLGTGQAALALVEAIGARDSSDPERIPSQVEHETAERAVLDVEEERQQSAAAERQQDGLVAESNQAPRQLPESIAMLFAAASVFDPGTVVAFSADGTGRLIEADSGAGAHVAGVVVAAEKATLRDSRIADGVQVAVALSGVAEVRVDPSLGEILPGDLLVSSPNPGYAMREIDPAPGAVIGRAIGALEADTGTVRVLLAVR